MLTMLLAMALAQIPAEAAPAPGVSQQLARERAGAIGDLRYELTFFIPERRTEPVRGKAVVRFRLASPQRVVFDFAQPSEKLREVRVGGRVLAPRLVNGHVVIPSDVTRQGANEISFEFVAGDEALNRNDEFLYTLFVPARAQLTFPCFDQPDLKGRYALALEVPVGWQTVANGRETGRVNVGSDRTMTTFAETEPLATYLFSFVAGKFAEEKAVRGGREIRFLHRETDAAKVARNRDAIVNLHAAALTWLEAYTDIPYAWGKFEFVLIPSFQFGGMEHPGAILYNASMLLLDESATQNQLLERASVIAHETAHMWFGDLVTMAWFDDVWMKEVFANFMAAKIVNPSFPDVNHDLRFFLSHYPGAYQVDRSAGANPIRQRLANLNEAGQLYGAIIYQKAPIVMRQLELIVSEERMRDGLRTYLKQHAHGNATWLDLVNILDRLTPEDIAAWSRAWVEERGRPEFDVSVETDRRGRLQSVGLRQTDPLRRNLVWPQRVQVEAGFKDGVKQLPATVAGQVTRVNATPNLQVPLYVLPTAGGLAYGLFVLDARSRAYLLDSVEEVADPVSRGAAWVTLWDNLLAGHVRSDEFFDAILRALPAERDEQNAQRVLAFLTRTYWGFMSPEQRGARAAAIEATLRAGIARGRTQSQKSAWFNAYRDVVSSSEGVAWLTRLWRRSETVPGLTFAEPDEINMALELAVREAPGWDEILRVQHDRTANPDRKARFAFVMPALSADPRTREEAFARFKDAENRRREPWVLESLRYLNHPLREAHARQFVAPALEMLREIQRTGDIFFPTRWIDSTLWGHRSPEVAATVRRFLDDRPDYPQRLRWTILSAADELFRAERF